MRLDLETEVRYPWGERLGRIIRVIFGEENEVEAVVIATDDLVSRSVIVPLEMLSEAPGGVTTLNATPDYLDTLETYEEAQVAAVPDGWAMSRNAAFGGDVFPTMFNQPIVPVIEVENLREGLMSVSQGTEIACLDGAWGIVDEVLVSVEGQAYALIGRPYAVEEHDRIIPLELLAEVSPDRALLNCALADLATFTQETVDEYEEPEPA